MSARVARCGLILLSVLLACGSHPQTPPEPPAPPTGGPPRVEITVAAGNIPVEGEIILTPTGDSRNWGYVAQLDEAGTERVEGIVTNEVRIPYRFTMPGLRSLNVTLQGPGDIYFNETRTIIANDPQGARIVASRDISESQGYFEGIAVDRRGEFVYAMNYGLGELHQLSAIDLAERARTLLGRIYPEGLSITPSDSFLFTIHKGRGLSVVALPSLEVRRHVYVPGSFFVHALDDTLALSSGRSAFALVDTRLENGVVAQLQAANSNVPSWHFAVSPDGRTAAVLDRYDPPIAFLIRLPTLTIDASLALPLQQAYSIAYDSDGSSLYVAGSDGSGARFLQLDVGSGTVLMNQSLGPSHCRGFCAANPAATSFDGRYVTFALDDAAYFIDTASDQVAYSLRGLGSGVAADPRSRAFYFIRPDGVVTKVALP